MEAIMELIDLTEQLIAKVDVWVPEGKGKSECLMHLERARNTLERVGEPEPEDAVLASLHETESKRQI